MNLFIEKIKGLASAKELVHITKLETIKDFVLDKRKRYLLGGEVVFISTKRLSDEQLKQAGLLDYVFLKSINTEKTTLKNLRNKITGEPGQADIYAYIHQDVIKVFDGADVYLAADAYCRWLKSRKSNTLLLGGAVGETSTNAERFYFSKGKVVRVDESILRGCDDDGFDLEMSDFLARLSIDNAGYQIYCAPPFDSSIAQSFETSIRVLDDSIFKNLFFLKVKKERGKIDAYLTSLNYAKLSIASLFLIVAGFVGSAVQLYLGWSDFQSSKQAYVQVKKTVEHDYGTKNLPLLKSRALHLEGLNKDNSAPGSDESRAVFLSRILASVASVDYAVVKEVFITQKRQAQLTLSVPTNPSLSTLELGEQTIKSITKGLKGHAYIDSKGVPTKETSMLGRSVDYTIFKINIKS